MQMTNWKMACAGLVLTLATVAPASAQEVISEPGYCAFFYPYANCQNKGPGNPYTDPYYPRGPAIGTPTWSGAQATVHRAKRTRTHRASSPDRY